MLKINLKTIIYKKFLINLKLKNHYKFTLYLIIFLSSFEIIARYIIGLGDPPLYVSHPTIEYEMAPSQKVKRFHRNIFINSLGMRSDELTNHKNKNSKRVLVYGDSIIWGGSFIDQKNIATEVLKRNLNKKENNFEVANISAGSWGPGNWLAHLKERGTYNSDQILIVISSDDWKDNPHFNSLKCTLSSPTEKPKLAINELFIRYFYSKISNYNSRMFEKLDCKEKIYPSNKGLNDLQEFFTIVLKNKIPIKVIQFWDREEFINEETKLGYSLVKDLANKNNLSTVDTLPFFKKCSSNPNDLFTDNIHPFTKLGQSCLAEVLEYALKNNFSF